MSIEGGYVTPRITSHRDANRTHDDEGSPQISRSETTLSPKAEGKVLGRLGTSEASYMPDDLNAFPDGMYLHHCLPMYYKLPGLGNRTTRCLAATATTSGRTTDRR